MAVPAPNPTEVFTHATLMASAEELKRARCQALALTIKREFMLEFTAFLYAKPQTPWKKQYSNIAPVDVRELYRELRTFFPDIVICIYPDSLSNLTVIMDYSRLTAPEDY